MWSSRACRIIVFFLIDAILITTFFVVCFYSFDVKAQLPVQPEWSGGKKKPLPTTKVRITSTNLYETSVIRNRIKEAVDNDVYAVGRENESGIVELAHKVLGQEHRLIEYLSGLEEVKGKEEQKVGKAVSGADTNILRGTGEIKINRIESAIANHVITSHVPEIPEYHSSDFADDHKRPEVFKITSIVEDPNFIPDTNIRTFKISESEGRKILIGFKDHGFIVVTKPNGTYQVDHDLELEEHFNCMESFQYWNTTSNQTESVVLLTTTKSIFWYRIRGMEQIWKLDMDNNITALRHFKWEDDHFLVIAKNVTGPSKAVTATADVYRFQFENRTHWRTQKIPVDHPFTNFAFLDTGTDFVLAIPQVDVVLIFLFNQKRNEFRNIVKLNADAVTSVTGFQMGDHWYLAITGYKPQILLYHKQEFVTQTILDSSFGFVQEFLAIPADTYRKDVILVVQHRISFSTHDLNAIELLLSDGEKFVTSYAVLCQVHGSETDAGSECMIDIDRPAGIRGSDSVAFENYILVFVPRDDAPSGVFTLTVELTPSETKADRLKRIQEAFLMWIAEQQTTLAGAAKELDQFRNVDISQEIWTLDDHIIGELISNGSTAKFFANGEIWDENFQIIDELERELDVIVKEVDLMEKKLVNCKNCTGIVDGGDKTSARSALNEKFLDELEVSFDDLGEYQEFIAENLNGIPVNGRFKIQNDQLIFDGTVVFQENVAIKQDLKAPEDQLKKLLQSGFNKDSYEVVEMADEVDFEIESIKDIPMEEFKSVFGDIDISEEMKVKHINQTTYVKLRDYFSSNPSIFQSSKLNASCSLKDVEFTEELLGKGCFNDIDVDEFLISKGQVSDHDKNKSKGVNEELENTIELNVGNQTETNPERIKSLTITENLKIRGHVDEKDFRKISALSQEILIARLPHSFKEIIAENNLTENEISRLNLHCSFNNSHPTCKTDDEETNHDGTSFRSSSTDEKFDSTAKTKKISLDDLEKNYLRICAKVEDLLKKRNDSIQFVNKIEPSFSLKGEEAINHLESFDFYGTSILLLNSGCFTHAYTWNGTSQFFYRIFSMETGKYNEVVRLSYLNADYLHLVTNSNDEKGSCKLNGTIQWRFSLEAMKFVEHVGESDVYETIHKPDGNQNKFYVVDRSRNAVVEINGNQETERNIWNLPISSRGYRFLSADAELGLSVTDGERILKLSPAKPKLRRVKRHFTEKFRARFKNFTEQLAHQVSQSKKQFPYKERPGQKILEFEHPGKLRNRYSTILQNAKSGKAMSSEYVTMEVKNGIKETVNEIVTGLIDELELLKSPIRNSEDGEKEVLLDPEILSSPKNFSKKHKTFSRKISRNQNSKIKNVVTKIATNLWYGLTEIKDIRKLIYYSKRVYKDWISGATHKGNSTEIHANEGEKNRDDFTRRHLKQVIEKVSSILETAIEEISEVAEYSNLGGDFSENLGEVRNLEGEKTEITDEKKYSEIETKVLALVRDLLQLSNEVDDPVEIDQQITQKSGVGGLEGYFESEFSDEDDQHFTEKPSKNVEDLSAPESFSDLKSVSSKADHVDNFSEKLQEKPQVSSVENYSTEIPEEFDENEETSIEDLRAWMKSQSDPKMVGISYSTVKTVAKKIGKKLWTGMRHIPEVKSLIRLVDRAKNVYDEWVSSSIESEMLGSAQEGYFNDSLGTENCTELAQQISEILEKAAKDLTEIQEKMKTDEIYMGSAGSLNQDNETYLVVENRIKTLIEDLHSLGEKIEDHQKIFANETTLPLTEEPTTPPPNVEALSTLPPQDENPSTPQSRSATDSDPVRLNFWSTTQAPSKITEDHQDIVDIEYSEQDIHSAEIPYIPSRTGGDFLALKVGPHDNKKTLIAVIDRHDHLVAMHHDEIRIYFNILRGEVYQRISTLEPRSLTALQLRDETLLAFIEGERVIRVYRHLGIEGFVEFAYFVLNSPIKKLNAINLPITTETGKKCWKHFFTAISHCDVEFYEVEIAGECKMDIDFECSKPVWISDAGDDI